MEEKVSVEMKKYSIAPLSRRGFLATAGMAASALAAPLLGGCTPVHSEIAKKQVSPRSLVCALDYTPNTNHNGLFLAQQRGYFEREGLEVELIQAPEDGSEAFVASGSAQFGISYQDYLAHSFALAQPLPIVALAALLQHNTSGIMARKDTAVLRPRDLEDKRYATWNLPLELATLRHLMQEDGGDFGKVKCIPFDVDDEVMGLSHNLFDAVWVFEGWAVQNARIQQFAHSYIPLVSWDDVFDFYTPVLIANTSFLQEAHEVAVRFMRAVAQGYADAIAEPSAAAACLLTAAPELDGKLVEESSAFLSRQYQAEASQWGVIDGKRWSRYYDWINAQGILDHQLSASEGFSMHILDEALKSM